MSLFARTLFILAKLKKTNMGNKQKLLKIYLSEGIIFFKVKKQQEACHFWLGNLEIENNVLELIDN